MRWHALLPLLLGLLAGACASDGDNQGRGGARSGGGEGGAVDAGGAITAGISGGGQVTGGSGLAGAGGDAGQASDAGTLQPVVIDDCGPANSSGLGAGELATLVAGGPAGDLGYLYPYDGTILPRGLIAPMLMWKGADDAQAVYVHVKSSLFELKGCYKPTGPGQLQMPGDIWAKAEAMTRGSADPFTIELHAIAGGVAKGPVALRLVIAQATLKGSIFYNSYASQLSAAMGAVLRVVPGKMVDLFIGGIGVGPGCNGCHSVSANGTRLVTLAIMSGITNAYAVDPTTMPNPAALHSNDAASFVGLSPDGSVYLTNASTSLARMRVGGTPTAALYETDTGAVVSGTDIPATALMPTFSPDGSLLVFNDTTLGDGKGLALMDWDGGARKASSYRKIYESPDDKLAGWPFVLPDNKAVVFQRGATTDFSGGNVGIALGPIPGPTVGPYGNLFIVDLGSGKATMLAKAMGYADESNTTAAGSHLPFRTDELDMNYYPTVSPVAAGGYFWVFFDSERHYGNKGLYRQLWGTAITISPSGQYTSDPSHPAFFLTGQEFATGNHRAFTALDPCKQDGDSCKSGIDCCRGFCHFPDNAPVELGVEPVGTCHEPEEPRCANTDEACKTSNDCCNPSDSCIAGFCGQVILE